MLALREDMEAAEVTQKDFEEAIKKLILEKFLKTGKVSDNDWKFCDAKDWHPVDELPLKKEFVRKLKGISKEKSIKINSVHDIFK